MSLFSAFKAAVNRNNTPLPAAGTEDTASAPGMPAVEATPELIGHPTSGTNLDPRKILIVDDNAADLAQLERDLEPMRAVWEMTFVQDARRAVLELSKKPFDAVMADLEMPELDGLSVLKEVASQLPNALRIIRCEAEKKSKVQAIAGGMPQVIFKQSDAEAIASSIIRNFRLNAWMGVPAVKSLLGRMKQLPSLPTLYTQVLKELNSPNGSMEVVAQTIAKDPVMTAKMLQVVNSAFFALSREIMEPVEAVMYMGAERTKSLILLAKVFSQFEHAKCPSFSVDELWRHSMTTAAFAMNIAKEETKDTGLIDMAFTAGLVHDIGKLLLAANVPVEYGLALDQAERRKLSAREVELEIFGATHASLGACLLATWGLPVPLLDAIAWHHEPLEGCDNQFSVTTAVHIANALYYEKTGDLTRGHASKIDRKYLSHLHMADRPNRWRQLCGCQQRLAAEDGSGKARTYSSKFKDAA
jgi:HD-like signal output (HDOD) protein/ActR/RegA family two-component response regulator